MATVTLVPLACCRSGASRCTARPRPGTRKAKSSTRYDLFCSGVKHLWQPSTDLVGLWYGCLCVQEFQSKELPNTRIQPDRRWFGNTRVIGQKQLEQFRDEMSAKVWMVEWLFPGPMDSIPTPLPSIKKRFSLHAQYMGFAPLLLFEAHKILPTNMDTGLAVYQAQCPRHMAAAGEGLVHGAAEGEKAAACAAGGPGGQARRHNSHTPMKLSKTFMGFHGADTTGGRNSSGAMLESFRG